MQLYRTFLTWFLLFLFLASCTEKITITEEVEVYPEKLSPYTVFYDSTTFKQRRDDFISKIPDDALAIIVTNDTYLRNGDVNFEFRPASNFYYLTGFDEPNAIAVITITDNIPTARPHLTPVRGLPHSSCKIRRTRWANPFSLLTTAEANGMCL